MKRISENEKRAVNGGFYYFSNNKNCCFASKSWIAYRTHRAFCSLCKQSTNGGSATKAGAIRMNKSV